MTAKRVLLFFLVAGLSQSVSATEWSYPTEVDPISDTTQVAVRSENFGVFCNNDGFNIAYHKDKGGVLFDSKIRTAIFRFDGEDPLDVDIVKGKNSYTWLFVAHYSRIPILRKIYHADKLVVRASTLDSQVTDIIDLGNLDRQKLKETAELCGISVDRQLSDEALGAEIAMNAEVANDIARFNSSILSFSNYLETDYSSDVYSHKGLLNKLGYVSDENVNETVDAEYYEGFKRYFTDVEQITTDFYKRCSDLNFITKGMERNECQRFHHRQRERTTARVDVAFCELKRIAEQHVGTAETYDIYEDKRCNCDPRYGSIAKECFLER